jgi:hypothetical protein
VFCRCWFGCRWTRERHGEFGQLIVCSGCEGEHRLPLYNSEVFFTPDAKIDVYWPGIDRKRMNRWTYALSLLGYVRDSIQKSQASTVVSFGDWFNAYTLVASIGLGLQVLITNRMGPGLRLGFVHETYEQTLVPTRSWIGCSNRKWLPVSNLENTWLRRVIVIPNGLG